MKNIFIILITISIIGCRAYSIPSNSMEDTIMEGDNILVQLLFNFELKRGDLVVFRPPHDPERDFIKRCIAVSGDKFEIKNGYVFINDKKLDEKYARGLTFYDSSKKDQRSMIEGMVPRDKIVVLSDNREQKMDSRYFGYLESDRIVGKPFFIVRNAKYPGRFGFIKK
jgi:signal peptidase I